MTVKLLIADDHPLIREALSDRFSALGDQYETSTVADGHALLSRLELQPETALVLLDLYMPGPHGADLLSTLRDRFPHVKIVVVTGSEDPADRELAARFGAADYVLKTAPSPELVAVVERVLAGEESTSQAIDKKRPRKTRERATTSPLTHRQVEVLELIAAGLSNKEIARKLQLSEHIVKIHVAAILQVLGVCNRTQAAVKARSFGISPQMNQVTEDASPE